MFEILRRDGMARIGKFTTTSGRTVETPTLLPVINPKIKTVLPNETSDIAIDPEMDYCTLLTCTPYGINSHRLLVRGHRVPTDRALNEDGSYGSYVIEAPPEVRTGPPMEEIMAVAGAVLLGIAAVRFGRTVRSVREKRKTRQNPPQQ